MAREPSTFIPSPTDFDQPTTIGFGSASSAADFDPNLPPYPLRFLTRPSSTSVINSSSVPLRRVRPIPIPPPPGFEPMADTHMDLNGSYQSTARYDASSAGHSSNAYAHFAKWQAIVGALVSDWATK
jgi:hypothetical protein